MLIHFSDKLGIVLANRVQKDYLAPAYSYAIQYLTQTLLNYLIIIVVSLYVGIFLETLAASLILHTFRIMTGGAHFKNSLICFISGLITVFGISYLSIFLFGYLGDSFYMILVPSYIFALIGIKKNVPTPTPHRAIELHLHKKFKLLAFTFLNLLLTLTIFIQNYFHTQPWLYAIWLSISIQTFSTFSFGFKTFETLENCICQTVAKGGELHGRSHSSNH